MTHSDRRGRSGRFGAGHCRGQSMTEFLVALAVLAPLFLAVTFAGRYGDIMHSSVQASRYAAFQRAMQPSQATLPDSKIQDQMRARFFVRGNYMHNGALQSDDSIANLRGDTAPTMWRDLSFHPVLTAPTSVTLSMGTAALNSGGAQQALNFVSHEAGKTYSAAAVANVEVTLVNKFDLSRNATPNLTIGATAAAVGDALSSSGSQATRDAAATIVPLSHVPGALNGFLNAAMHLFEQNGPTLGCIKPDVVPTGRLQGYAPAGACQ